MLCLGLQPRVDTELDEALFEYVCEMVWWWNQQEGVNPDPHFDPPPYVEPLFCLSYIGSFLSVPTVSRGSMSKEGIVEGSNVMDEELVVKHPKSSKIIKYSCSIFFVMELAVYIVLMVSLFIVSTQSW